MSTWWLKELTCRFWKASKDGIHGITFGLRTPILEDYACETYKVLEALDGVTRFRMFLCMLISTRHFTYLTLMVAILFFPWSPIVCFQENSFTTMINQPLLSRLGRSNILRFLLQRSLKTFGTDVRKWLAQTR